MSTFRIAVDYDGSMADARTGQLFEGVGECLQAMKRAGVHLTLLSARATMDGNSPALPDEAARFWQFGEVPARAKVQWNLFDQMRANLRALGLWDLFDDVWQSPGKPLCDRFIEDRAEAPDWTRLRLQYGQEVTT